MEQKRKLLFVEGVNDREVVYRIENHYNLRDICCVLKMDSDDGVSTALELHINEQASKTHSVGIVIDADLDFTARWTSIRNILVRSNSYQVPLLLPENGLILDSVLENHPRVGVWIMPNNRDSGMLEDFMRGLLHGNDSLIPEVDSVLSQIESKGLQRYKQVHKTKAWIHTFLAWQDEPGSSLALAVDKRILDPSAKSAELFAFWMKSLYCD